MIAELGEIIISLTEGLLTHRYVQIRTLFSRTILSLLFGLALPLGFTNFLGTFWGKKWKGIFPVSENDAALLFATWMEVGTRIHRANFGLISTHYLIFYFVFLYL